jgi:hypothetical protein
MMKLLKKWRKREMPSKAEQLQNCAETFNSEVTKLAVSMANLVISKQQKYGKSNINDFGEMGILIRMNDKFARLKNMLLNNVQDTKEPIDDTLRDIIGYSLLWIMLRDGTFNLPLIPPEQYNTITSSKIYIAGDIFRDARKAAEDKLYREGVQSWNKKGDVKKCQ